MRGALILTLATALAVSPALAQTAPSNRDPAAQPAPSSPDPADQRQPPGPTGTSTTSGGASAQSPQGDTPPGLMPVPQDPKMGSSSKK